MTETATDTMVLSRDELQCALEAVLFASGDPVSLERICEITGVEKNVAVEAMAMLADRYLRDTRSALSVRRLENDYVLCTKPEMKAILERFFRPRSRPPMSQATYETLAVIAYNQPSNRFAESAVTVSYPGFWNGAGFRNAGHSTLPAGRSCLRPPSNS
jgi:segregation and condensation protein B